MHQKMTRTSARRSTPGNAGLDTERTVGLAFADAQRSQATHIRALKSLSRAYDADDGAFLQAFLHALNRALVVFAREPAVERVVTFVAAFTAAQATRFANPLLAYLVEHTRAVSKAVRFRSVQTIAAVVTALPENAEVSDDVWEPLLECVTARSRDRVPRVRAAAAAALCRLQTTGDPADDAVAARLIEMLTKDSSAAVRKSALVAVAVTPATIPALLSRTRDVKDDVRKAAFQMLARKLSPHDLEVAERLSLLKAGLRNRSAGVREACANELLLGGWLQGACEGNVFLLVDLLGGYTEEDLVLQALSTVFKSEKHQHLLEDIEIDINNLSLSDALVLRAMSQIKKSDTALDRFIPSALAYSEVLKYYAVDSFASCHLLALSKGLDLSDEAGRRALESTVRNEFLRSRRVSHETVPAAVQALKTVTFDPESTVRSLTELVRDKILKVDDGESEKVIPESMPETQDEELTDEEMAVWRERRALLICKEALKSCRPSQSDLVSPNSSYLELVHMTAVRQLLSEHNENRATALECLALFCLLDKSGMEARTKIQLFLQASNDEVSVAQMALKAIIDFMMTFDLNSTTDTPDTESGTSQNRPQTPSDGDGMAEECLQLVAQFMTHIEGDLRTLAVEGMAKLLFTRRVIGTSSMISRLLIAYHNPSTEDDTRLRQCLSVFFNAYAMLSSANRQVLESAMLPTLKVFDDAPSSSPLSTVSTVQVGQFVLHLVGLGEKDEMVVLEMHARIAEESLNLILDIIDDENSIVAVRSYAKLLSGMRSDDEMEKNGVLLKLADTALEFSEDKRTTTCLRKFRDHVGCEPVSHVDKKGRTS